MVNTHADTHNSGLGKT